MKVYCKYCVNYFSNNTKGYMERNCTKLKLKAYQDTYLDLVEVWEQCEEKNKNNCCPDFKLSDKYTDLPIKKEL